MSEVPNLPATNEDAAFLQAAGLDNMKMSTGLAIFMKPSLYAHCKAVALRMSEAKGIIGPHLIGEPSACMAVLSRAITWNLDPFAVAQCTYAIKGKVGYEGKLVQAILENSGQLEGQIKYEFFGEWSKLRGMFKIVEGGGGEEKKKPVATWKPEDEEGLGLTVSAQVKGETHPREEEFFLAEMFPRNSTLWVTRPKQQMIYASIRAFANIAMPGILMGIPFDIDAGELGGGSGMQDITPPKPTKSNEFTRDVRGDTKLQEWVTKANFAKTQEEIDQIESDGTKEISPDHHERWHEVCDTRAGQIKQLSAASEERNRQEDAERQKEVEEKTIAQEATSDHDWKHIWGDRLADTKDVKDVAEVRAAGLKELPEHLHAEWNAGCDSRAKAIAEKPRAPKANGKKPEPQKPEPKPEPVRDNSALARGRRILAKLDNLEDVADLHATIRGELENDAETATWDGDVAERRKALGGS